jgi:hypothetical protein
MTLNFFTSESLDELIRKVTFGVSFTLSLSETVSGSEFATQL